MEFDSQGGLTSLNDGGAHQGETRNQMLSDRQSRHSDANDEADAPTQRQHGSAADLTLDSMNTHEELVLNDVPVADAIVDDGSAGVGLFMEYDGGTEFE